MRPSGSTGIGIAVFDVTDVTLWQPQPGAGTSVERRGWR
jgi:hypothetical protein